jgi:AcrR family transcriptional regulator
MSDASTASDRPRAHDRSSPVEQDIFAATERLLLTVSARDLSVAKILGEAGVARGSFYHYFSSKWDVITVLVTGVMEDIHRYIEGFASTDEPLSRQDALRHSIQRGCEVWAQHRAVLRVILEHWREEPQLREIWLAALHRIRDLLAPELDKARAAGHAPPGPDSRQLITALLWGTANCLYAAGLDGIDDLPGELEISPVVEELWIRALFVAGLPD